MKSNQLSLLLSVACLALLLLSAATSSDGNFNKLTAREFDLVDKSNTRRVNIRVEDSGEVVFRMFDGKGTIRVKLGAGEDGSGMVLLDEATNPGVHLLSGASGIKLSLTGKDGKKRDL